jgi:hypothetical protein
MIDEFYIGYESTMPPRMARRVLGAALALLALAVTIPPLLLAVQGRFSTGRFEYGTTRTFEGRLVEFPYPALDVVGTGTAPAFHWLVGPGKHGAADLVHGLDGRVVRLQGTLIERDGDAMLQIEAGSVMSVRGDGDTKSSVPVRVRTLTVTGELVDSKCHLGVMEPGEGPLHRDCAVRCLLGAVPPMIVVRSSSGIARRLALVDETGRPFFSDFSSLAGRPLTIRGTLLAQGARNLLAARVAEIEILR